MPPNPAEEAVLAPPPSVQAALEAPARPASGMSLRGVVWSLALSLAVLGVVGYFTFDPAAFGPFLDHLSPWLLAAALAAVALRVLFGAWRLRYFSGGRLGLRGSVRSQIVWDFFAYITPSTVGGGPFAAVFIARDQRLPLGEATAVVLFSMLVDQICFALTIPVLLACTAFVEVFPPALGTVGHWSLVLFFCGYLAWVLAFAYGTLVRPQHLVRVVAFVFRLRWLRRLRPRAVRAMEDLRARSGVLRAQPPGFYVRGFVLTLLPWLLRYLLVLLVIWSVYPGVDGVPVFLRAAALHLGALAMPTPGGAGGVEGLYVLFLGPPLVPEPLVAPTLLVWRLLSFYAFLAVGAVLVMRHLRRHAGAKRRPRAGATGV
ncbi:MAG TPA: lysylphosphatidylglycerol synthase transmembrane domain-containing protein [Rubricoccaceae bacterium]|nr:lysylphosphatidylglycerol synthase transmembrane domain-containing protein [Rubricoccaceae bacterium]